MVSLSDDKSFSLNTRKLVNAQGMFREYPTKLDKKLSIENDDILKIAYRKYSNILQGIHMPFEINSNQVLRENRLDHTTGLHFRVGKTQYNILEVVQLVKKQRV